MLSRQTLYIALAVESNYMLTVQTADIDILRNTRYAIIAEWTDYVY